MRISIKVEAIEFEEGGNTLWVQGLGGTVLRIKTIGGQIKTETCTTNPVSHADLMTKGDVVFCLGQDHEDQR